MKPQSRIGLILCVWALTLVFCGQVMAAGFALYEWGSRGQGMAGALIATQNPDASGLAYNPASLAFMERPQALAGATLIAPTAKVKIHGSTDTETDPQDFLVPYAYYVHPVTDNVVLGIGEYTRFGLGTEYSKTWPGRFRLYDVQFESFSAQPTVAFHVNDNLAFGLGLEIMRAEMDIRKVHPALGDMHINVDGTAIGGNVSALYKFNEQWALGFMARTPMKLHGSGNTSTATFNAALNGETTIEAELPDSYTLGLSYSPIEDLTIELDAMFTRWEQYSKVTYEFPGATSVDEKFWKNTWRFQLGAEYEALDWMTVRAGYIWDQEPVRDGHEDYMLPSNDRQFLTCGLGFNWSSFTLDLSYMYMWTKDRDDAIIHSAGLADQIADFHDVKAHLVGLNAAYTF